MFSENGSAANDPSDLHTDSGVPGLDDVAAVKRRRRPAAVVFTIAGVAALAAGVAGCSSEDASEPTSASPTTSAVASASASAVPVAQVPGQDCTAAAEKYNNKHNVCASWDGTQAAPFVSVGQVGTSTQVFSVTEFNAGGTSDHHVTQQPGSFGATTWGATSADDNYSGEMNWTFSVSEPSDTVTGWANQTKDTDGNQGCGNGTYIACTATGQVGQIGGSSNPTNPVNRVSYQLANAPMAITVINNTGQTMTQRGAPQINYLQASSTGTSGNSACIAPASAAPSPAPAPTPCPSPSGAAPIAPGTATYAFYRQVGGSGSAPAGEVTMTYLFTDANNPQVTHNVTIDVQAVPGQTASGNPSICTDAPIGGSSPNQATCDTVWSGTSSWLDMLTLQVTVNAAP